MTLFTFFSLARVFISTTQNFSQIGFYAEICTANLEAYKDSLQKILAEKKTFFGWTFLLSGFNVHMIIIHVPQ